MGLSNLEYLSLQEKMGNLLLEKKKLDIKVKDKKNNEEQTKFYRHRVEKKQKEAKLLLIELKKLKDKKQGQCVETYIQFQSMNGKQKFLDSFKIGSCRRDCIMKCGCCGKRSDIEHKYLGSSWPKARTAPDPSLIIW